MAQAHADPLIGRTLRGGEYHIRDVIASGGQATVYRAYARSLETDVAVKVLKPELAADFAFRQRFQEEARTLARLHHENLLSVYWYGEDGELVYIAMRLVPPGTLKDRLRAVGGALGLVDTARIVGQVADALQHAHDNDVLHLDIKPGNVLLGRADWPLVADLGLTRAISREVGSSGESRVAGTPAYMSPEQCQGGVLDGRSDQYSLAVMAYELLLGQQPFKAETTDGLMQQHISSSPRRPRDIDPSLPGPVEEVILRGLAKQPADRFPTIKEFGTALSDAVERTRGVSLETKLAAAATAPNMLAILALVLAAPFMLAMLPIGNVLGVIRLEWPFQLLLDGSIAALLLGIRWHLIGLAGRAMGQVLDSIDRASRYQVSLGTAPSGPLRVGAWRRAAVASAEGVVNLLYLLATYRLVGAPVLTVLHAVLDPTVYRFVETGLLVLIGLAALGIVYGIFRAAGALAAAAVLALGWVIAVVLPKAELDLSGAETVSWTAQLVVGGGLLVLLMAQRARARAMLAQLADTNLGRLLAEGRPDLRPEQIAARRVQIGRLTGCLLDFAYLLMAYALLRAPVVGILSSITTPIAAAILASGLAALVWIALTVRLREVAGITGALLGIVLGAPILISLPVFETTLIQTSWPATVASWVAGAAALILLAILRGPTQAFSQAAFGARLDRGLLGTTAAENETKFAGRVGALGRVAGALIDVGFLLIGYWVVGVPATAALVRTTGTPAVASIVLGGVLVMALVLILLPSRQAAASLVDAGGSEWRGRARALVAIALVAAAVFVAAGAATPAVVAGSPAISPITVAGPPDPVRAVSQVVVDWDFWLPWSPREDQATYNLSLSCSNGKAIGQFREAFTPPAGEMKAGANGRLGPTGVDCDDWQLVYAQRRRDAGLGNQASSSIEWHHVQADSQADGTIAFTETYRVLFSAGRHTSLNASLGNIAAGDVSDLEVWESDVRYPVQAIPSADRYAQMWVNGAERWVGWSFPAIEGPAERTYVLRYRLKPADSSSEAMLYRLVTNQPTWRTTVDFRLPDAVSPSQLALNAEGAPVQSGVVGSRSAWFEAADLFDGQALTFSVMRIAPVPPPPPPPGPPPTPTSTPETPVAEPTSSAIPVAGATSTATSPASTQSPTAAPASAAAEATAATPEAEPSDITPTSEAPTPSPTGGPDTQPEATDTPLATPETITPTPTVSVTATSTVTSTASSTPTASPLPTLTPTATLTPTVITTATATSSPTATPTATNRPRSGDSTPPDISVSLSPTPNALGWNNSDVTVTWLVSDPQSDVPSTSGCDTTVIRAETSGTILTCTAINSHGLQSVGHVTVRLDKTRPTLDTRVAIARLVSGGPVDPETLQITVFSTEELAEAPSVAVSGPCLTTATVPTARLATADARYAGTYTAPLTANCTAQLHAAGRDFAFNPSLGGDAQAVIDNILPIAQSIQINGGAIATNNPIVTLTLAAVDPGTNSALRMQLSTDGVTWSAEEPFVTSRSFTLPGGDGTRNAFFRVIDAAENISLPASASILLDRTPPILTIDASPTAGRAGTGITFTVRPDEALGGPPTVEVSGSCVATQALSMTLVTTLSYTGTYTIPAGTGDCLASATVTSAVDVAGNPTATNPSASVQIDRTAPVLSVTASPRGRAGSTIDVSISASEPLDAAPTAIVTGACIATSTLSTVTPTSSATSYTATFVVPAGTTDCTATVSVDGLDLVGNPSPTATATFDIDRTPPVLTVTDATPSPARAGVVVTITVTSNESLSGVPEVNVTGACVPTQSVPLTPVLVTLLPTFAGAYTVPTGTTGCVASANVIAATDLAGNALVIPAGATPPHRDFVIDRSTEVPTVTARPSRARADATVSITVAGGELLAGPPPLDVTGTCIPTSRPIASPSGQSVTYTAAYAVPSGSSDCVATVSATVSDVAGNTASGSTTFTVDRTPPVLTVVPSPAAVVPGDVVTVNVTANETLGGGPTIVIPATTSCVGSTTVVSVTSTGPTTFTGTFTVPSVRATCAADIVATAQDVAGNSGTGTARISITAPTPTATATPTATPTPTVTATPTDTPPPILVASALSVGASGGSVAGTPTVTGSPTPDPSATPPATAATPIATSGSGTPQPPPASPTTGAQQHPTGTPAAAGTPAPTAAANGTATPGP